MTREEKTQALLATAKAYYDREGFCQYDQRSMDRLIQLTPRRRKRLPPEAATSQYTLFLDCSGFVSAVYYQAFGYELPFDLTWHMVDYLEPRIYFYEITHKETPEELKIIEENVRNILQAGDLVVYDRGSGSGHIMLYLGNGEYTDCTSGDCGNSYDYENRANRFYERGIWKRSCDLWFEMPDGTQKRKRSFFESDKRRFAIIRPLDILGDPTPDALSRIGAAKDLCCGVLSSHALAVHAAAGEQVTYTVSVKNLSADDREVDISFTPPKNAEFKGLGNVKVKAFSGETIEAMFTVTVLSDQDNSLDAPKVTVNTLNVYAPQVLLGKKLAPSLLSDYIKKVKGEILSGNSAVFSAIGKSERDILYSHFYLHDTPTGDVLSRRPQQPKNDIGVYSMFGGQRVITPEMGSCDGIRCTHICKSDLMAGDVIVCFDNAYGTEAYSCFYDGKELCGSFEANDKTHSIEGEQLERFMDSLFGRFCFILLRPQLKD